MSVKLNVNWQEYSRLSAEGYLDKQIAKYMGMSPNTLQRRKREKGLTCKVGKDFGQMK